MTCLEDSFKAEGVYFGYGVKESVSNQGVGFCYSGEAFWLLMSELGSSGLIFGYSGVPSKLRLIRGKVGC